jgi:small subunit ribosomal protein S21
VGFGRALVDSGDGVWYVRRFGTEGTVFRAHNPFRPPVALRANGSSVGPEEGLVIVQIFVRDNNVDQALKALKKKMQREGTFREMKRHVHYEKPSEKRARQKAEAVRRARKLARKRAQREGLLPNVKPPVARAR